MSIVKSKKMLALVSLALLVASVLVCAAMIDDDSSAATHGSVSPTGTYDLSGHTLTIYSETPSSTTSVTISGLNSEEKLQVETVLIVGYTKDLSGSFTDAQGYSNVTEIIYNGSITPDVGGWEYNYTTHKLTVKANSMSDAGSVTLNNFEFQSSVTLLAINNFQNDITSSFPSSSFTSLDGNIFYEGTLGTAGLWSYDMKTNTITVDRVTGSTTGYPGTYTADSAPFSSKFFAEDIETAVYKTFTKNCNYLFSGLPNLRVLRAPNYDDYGRSGLLNGIPNLQEIYMDSIETISGETVPLTKVGTSLRVFSSESATNINGSAFYNFTSLTTIYAPHVNTVQNQAFLGCTSLTNVTLTNAELIGNSAFNGCSSLRNITLNSAATISQDAFKGCTGLRTVTLPLATTLQKNAFSGCLELQTVTLGKAVSVGESAFLNCRDLTTISAEWITSIDKDSFKGCSSLAGPLIFSRLTTITSSNTNYPFNGCESLIEVRMPTLTSMGPYSFYGCTGLQTVVIGGLINTIPEYAFGGCTSLASITMSENTATIDIGAFSGCTSLETVTFPANLVTIGQLAFYRAGLTVLSTNNVQTIGDEAFKDSHISTLILGEGTRTIGASAFSGAPITGTIIFPKNVTSIGASAFSGLPIGEVRFATDANATTFVTIGASAFYQCGSLTNIVLGDRVTVIGTSAFSTCSMLSTLSMGTKVTTIEANAFYNCPLLVSVIDLPSTLTILGTNAFSGTSIRGLSFDANCTLETIPSGAFQNCRSLDGTVAIPRSVTTIASSAFAGDVSLDGLTFNENSQIESIDASAFAGCTALTGTVAFPDSLTSIGDYAFQSTDLRGITFSATGSQLTSIGEYAFNLSPITGTLIIPNRVTEIKTYAFDNCNIETLILGQGLRSDGLGINAFSYNPMTEIVIPNTASGSLTLPGYVFAQCPLENVHISSSVNDIRAYAFDYSYSTAKTVNYWFNGNVSEITFKQNSFRYVGTVTMNVHADAASEATCLAMKDNRFVSVTTLNYIKESSATVSVETHVDSAPLISSFSAIYGGKVILPYVRLSTGYVEMRFAVKDSNDVLLSMFSSDADYNQEHPELSVVAKSGDIVAIYPLGNDVDNIVIDYHQTGEGFTHNMTITTDSSEVAVDIPDQVTWYGHRTKIPEFLQSSIIEVEALYAIRDDDVQYSLPVDTDYIYIGYFFKTIKLVPREIMVDVTFISRGDEQIISVPLQSPFIVPANLKYMEQPDAGYTFMGWYSSPTGGIKANENTRFSIGQRWYARFSPIEYTLTVVCDEPAYSITRTMTGPFTLHEVNKSLYYTDTLNASNVLLFDADSVPGWSVDIYEDANNPGMLIIGDYGPLTTNVNVDLYMVMNSYTITLRFEAGGEVIPASEKFTIEGWEVGAGTQYATGDVISGIPYSMIENGLTMPVPVNQTYAFVRMDAGAINIPYNNGRYALVLDDFAGETSATIIYTVEAGLYTIMFELHDDLDTKFTYQQALRVGQSFTMPSVQRNYSKTGYEFSHLEVAGLSTGYYERQVVPVTDEMAATAVNCVITVNAIWSPLPYTISFNLLPYEGTLPDLTNVHEGDTIVLPTITEYHGYRAAAWHWYKNTTVSPSFTVNQVLTKEIIDNYADDDKKIMIQVEWQVKTYTLSVDTSYGYIFEQKTVTFGDDFTLWTNTYSRSFMRFAGWSIGSTIYQDSATVPLDITMATAGDQNNDKIVFGMYWIDNEYQVQYNLDGGEGQIPVDDRAYVVNVSAFALAADTGEFYRYGYSFVGWKYSRDSPIVYTNTSGLFEPILAQSADDHNIVTFYAVWSQKSYKISYNLDGGRQGPDAPTNVLYGNEVLISNPTRVGYEFLGWTAQGQTSGALYRSASGYRVWDGTTMVKASMFMDLCSNDGGTVIMSAHWGQATFAVSHDFNGGTGDLIVTQIEIRVGEVIELPIFRNAYKNGYSFAGWGIDTVNPLAEGTVFTESMVQGSENTLMLYAVWNPVSYQVKYRFTADYDYNTIVAEFSEPVYIPIDDRPGYTFKGWALTGVGTDAYYSKDGSTWYRVGSAIVDGTYFKNLSSTAGGVVTLDATWADIQYRIAYNANGGTGKAPVDSNLYVVGDPVEMKDYKSLIGTNGSKTVVGWSLDPTGSVVNITEFTPGLCNAADATRTVNLYAVWVDDMCLVIVNLEGSTASSIPAGWTQNISGNYEKLVAYGSSTKEVLSDWDDVSITKDGYNFTGWSYSDSTVLTTIDATPNFEKVNMSILYIFGGVVGAFVIGAIVITKL